MWSSLAALFKLLWRWQKLLWRAAYINQRDQSLLLQNEMMYLVLMLMLIETIVDIMSILTITVINTLYQVL